MTAGARNHGERFGDSLTHEVVRRIVPPVTEKLRIWLSAIVIPFGLAIVGFIVSAYMINGEEICLDRRPWWGPPESGYDDLAPATCTSGCIRGRLDAP